MGLADRDYFRDRSWRRRKPSERPPSRDRSRTAERAQAITGESYPPSAAAPVEAYSPILAGAAKRRRRWAAAAWLAAFAFVGAALGAALVLPGACS